MKISTDATGNGQYHLLKLQVGSVGDLISCLLETETNISNQAANMNCTHLDRLLCHRLVNLYNIKNKNQPVEF